MKNIRAYVDVKLLQQIKTSYPEVKGLSATGVVDWSLRKNLKEVKR